MSLRDLFLFGILGGLVPTILAHPYIGALAWVWFGVMNPHRLTWGAAYHFQFSFAIAILTAIGMLCTREHRVLKGGAAGIVLIVFTAWICVTTLFPFNPDAAFEYWKRVMKVFAMTGVLLLLLHTRRHVEILVWTMAVSLGFYGIKGGIFTILTGGNYMVNGPDDSVMQGNNSLAVGMIIVVPLLVHLYQQYRSRWLRLGLAGAAALCALSVLGSYSRGALLGVFAMGCLLWLRSTNKAPLLVVIVLFMLVTIPAMPENWTTRMRTLETYEEDSSALQRLAAWETAFNIAKDKFPIAGGLEWQSPETSARYSPAPEWEHVAHSIYFQVLGSQGFIGLGLYLLFWWLVWRQCAWIRRATRDQADLRWAFSLASMTQVGLVGYAVGGAFLDLAFWDLPYYLFAAVCITQYIVREQLTLRAQCSQVEPAPLEAHAMTGASLSVTAGSKPIASAQILPRWRDE